MYHISLDFLIKCDPYDSPYIALGQLYHRYIVKYQCRESLAGTTC